ncbi:Replication_factor C [Hexamita inflata]|uniref:Subunit 1 n=1 Tax=Hexamita inflata TaxID=28002 RepID=A0AA86R000_9EUKA|nr:Replication factor C [Hexamita inflata]
MSIPRLCDGCLDNMQFVRTGELTTMTEKQLSAYLMMYGAKLGSSVSKNTNYVIIGAAPGATKLAAAEKNGVPMVNESEFFDMVKNASRKAGAEPELVDYKDALKPLDKGAPVEQVKPQAPKPKPTQTIVKSEPQQKKMPEKEPEIIQPENAFSFPNLVFEQLVQLKSGWSVLVDTCWNEEKCWTEQKLSQLKTLVKKGTTDVVKIANELGMRKEQVKERMLVQQ